ncbi:unnamed protein product, partial [Ectocarpus fasciculatus]
IFRDPAEAVGSRTGRRFSSAVYSSRLAGTTRTFRDPIISRGSETAGTAGRRSSTGRRRGSRSDMDRMLTGGASDSPSTTCGGNQTSTANDGSSRRASLFEWLVAKKGTAGGAELSEYMSAVECGSGDEQGAVHDEEQELGHGFSDYEASVDMISLRRQAAAVEISEEGATTIIPPVDNISSDAPLTAEALEHHAGTHNGGKNNRNTGSASTALNGNDMRHVLAATAGRSLPRRRSTSTSSRKGGDDEVGDAVLPEFHQPHDGAQEDLTIDEPTTPAATDIKDIYADDVTDGESRRVTFLSGTMGLTVDISDPMQPQPTDEFSRQHQKHDDCDQWPASPCSGVILDTSPRYGTLQAFRKEMASRGINAQMFHTGWKGSFLPPRDIRLFMTDSRKASVLYWRYKTGPFGRGAAAGANQGLGAEDRRVIPLSSLANIGPAELYRQGAPSSSSSSSRRNLLSWLSIPSPLRRANEDAPVGYGKVQKGKDLNGAEKDTVGLVEAVPVLALSYWVEGEPRWVGDQPKRLLVRPDNLDSFQRLSHGLRLCCLHFHNYSCPQDLEDIR